MRATDFLFEDRDEDLLKEILSSDIAIAANKLFKETKDLSDDFRISAQETFEEDYGNMSIRMMNLLLTVRKNLGKSSETYKQMAHLFDYFNRK